MYKGFYIYHDFLSPIAFNKATGKCYRARTLDYLYWQIDHDL